MSVEVPTPVLSRSAHDRVAHRRGDEQWLAAAAGDPRTRVLVLSPDRRAAVDGTTLRLLPPHQVTAAGLQVLLGEHDGAAHLAVIADDDVSAPGWVTLREAAVGLTALDSGLFTAAVALAEWHASHRHCPRCGSATEPIQAGWARRCVADGSQHFPRTDPAVIMLVDDGAGHCLLGRSAAWPAGRFSTLAGFVEAGESAEAAVAREVAEEVGVAVTDIRYFASQPHPFPASLMLGFTARLAGDPTIRTDDEEIAEAGWFTRDEVRAASDWDSPADSPRSRLSALPPRMSVARQLINAWVDADPASS